MLRALLLDTIRFGETDDPSYRLSLVPEDVARATVTRLPHADRVVAERIQAGDETAFLTLYREQYVALCEFALGYVGDRGAAEDLVSDLFFGIWRDRTTWAPSGSIRAYLFSAARYRSLNVLRDRRRHHEQHTSAAAIGETPGMAQPESARDVFDAEHEARVEASVWSVIAELPERARLVMTLRWKEEMPIPEIARVLGTTEVAVRQLHKRALGTLRSRLAGLFE